MMEHRPDTTADRPLHLYRPDGRHGEVPARPLLLALAAAVSACGWGLGPVTHASADRQDHPLSPLKLGGRPGARARVNLAALAPGFLGSLLLGCDRVRAQEGAMTV
jgi:hypothetical protein